MLQSILMQKAGVATQGLANILFGLSVGDRIPTITELSASLETARGNVQFAINNLKNLGAVKFNPRGHLGTFLIEIDYLKLAEICGVTNFVCAMPLPYSKKYEGLATGLYSALNSDDFSMNLAFMRGSSNRMDMLIGRRYDFLVMSKTAYLYYLRKGSPIEIIAELGPQTYVNKHVIVARKNVLGDWKGKKIGIDKSSVDQSELTMEYFKDKQVQFVPLMYNQFLEYIDNNEIDAAVWNADDQGIENKNFKFLDLEASAMEMSCTEAVLVCKKDDVITRRLVSEIIDIKLMKRQQRLVEENKITPCY